MTTYYSISISRFISGRSSYLLYEEIETSDILWEMVRERENQGGQVEVVSKRAKWIPKCMEYSQRYIL